MEETQRYFTVLFVDIVGSTQMYDNYGDTKANSIIHSALTRMIAIAQKHRGTLIKTIGDEIMCRFPESNGAVNAACEINEEFKHNPPSNEVNLSVKAGLHCGPALLKEDGDLFGDMVNVAARMADIAQARQIITTADVLANLFDETKLKCREFDRAIVKGKSEPLVIYEVVWEPQDVTTLSPRVSTHIHSPGFLPLEIKYRDMHRTISKDNAALSIGRGDDCDLVIHSPLASRTHATIQYSRGKFILSDQSTNGTYVQLTSGKHFYLRREQFPISESGMISLGENFQPENTHIIYFSIPS
ncbi:adenylate/guanylate cyclase domain-containing protein [Pseudomonadota bacterium]